MQPSGSSKKAKFAPYVALIPVLLGVFIAADDQTVIVTILPQIIIDMELGPYELDKAAWTITGYLLGYVAAMPLIGRLSDVWGHRRIYIWSLLAFMAGSAAVALSPILPSRNLEWLVAFRVFQAVGAGALIPISIAIVGDLFPSARRGIPLGLVGASAEGGGVIGPLWGGIITKFLTWEWVFWINIPLSIIVLILLVLLLRPSPRFSARIDYVGGGLIMIALASLTVGLSRISSPDGVMALFLFVSVVSIFILVLRQMRISHPLLPTSMFQNITFNAANLSHLFIGAALIIGMVTIPLMANTVQALSPLEGGLRLVRLTAAIPVGAILGGLAIQRTGYRIPTVLGLALTALGFSFMSRWGIDVSDPAMTTHLVIAGLGFGLVIAPISLAGTNSVQTGVRGTAAALVTATRLVGMTIGLATLTAWGAGRFQTLVAGIRLPFPIPGETAAQTQQRALEYETQVSDAGLALFQDFFLVAMGLSIIAILPALFMLRERIGSRD